MGNTDHCVSCSGYSSSRARLHLRTLLWASRPVLTSCNLNPCLHPGIASGVSCRVVLWRRGSPVSAVVQGESDTGARVGLGRGQGQGRTAYRSHQADVSAVRGATSHAQASKFPSADCVRPINTARQLQPVASMPGYGTGLAEHGSAPVWGHAAGSLSEDILARPCCARSDTQSYTSLHPLQLWKQCPRAGACNEWLCTIEPLRAPYVTLNPFYMQPLY